MWFKKKEAILGSILLLTIFSFYSCVDEPTIEPISRPFSSIRVVNLSTNVDQINITIDGKTPSSSLSSLALAQPTGYFNVESGKDTFLVKDNSGNEVFNGTADINAYERYTVVFSGTFTNDANNNFGVFLVDEAELYVSVAPKADSVGILFIDAAGDVDTIASKNYNIVGHTPTHDTTYTALTGPVSLGYQGIYSVPEAEPGANSFDFMPIDSSATVSTPTYNFTAGNRYYIFLYGNPNNLQIFKDEGIPPVNPTRN